MVFCITWWLVTFEASQKADQAEQTFHQADQAREAAKQAEPEAQRAYMPQAPDQAREEVKQAGQKAKPLLRRTFAQIGKTSEQLWLRERYERQANGQARLRDRYIPVTKDDDSCFEFGCTFFAAIFLLSVALAEFEGKGKGKRKK